MDSQLSPKNGINPLLWGPYYWKVFHLTAFGYPDNPSNEDKEVYKQFYISFAKILPCDACSVSSRTKMNLVNWDAILIDRNSLIEWSYNFHDQVNIKLDKVSPSFNDFLTDFTVNLNYIICKCSKKIEYIIILFLIVMLIMRYTLSTL